MNYCYGADPLAEEIARRVFAYARNKTIGSADFEMLWKDAVKYNRPDLRHARAEADAILALIISMQWRPLSTLTEEHGKVLLWVGGAYSHGHVKIGLKKQGTIYSVYDDGVGVGWLPETQAFRWMPRPAPPRELA